MRVYVFLLIPILIVAFVLIYKRFTRESIEVINFSIQNGMTGVFSIASTASPTGKKQNNIIINNRENITQEYIPFDRWHKIVAIYQDGTVIKTEYDSMTPQGPYLIELSSSSAGVRLFLIGDFKQQEFLYSSDETLKKSLFEINKSIGVSY
jgi:hypothetical protein